MNFAILNNNTVKTFNNNVIGFPSSTNDKFILKRENTNGSVSYSWIPFQHVSGNVNFTTKNYNTYLTTEKQSINIDSNDTGLIVIDILIDDIATLCNMNIDVVININDYQYKITPWIKFQQIIIESTESSINIRSNIKGHRLTCKKSNSRSIFYIYHCIVLVTSKHISVILSDILSQSRDFLKRSCNFAAKI